ILAITIKRDKGDHHENHAYGRLLRLALRLVRQHQLHHLDPHGAGGAFLLSLSSPGLRPGRRQQPRFQSDSCRHGQCRPLQPVSFSGLQGDIMFNADVEDLKVTRFFETSARVLLSLLIMAIFCAILIGIGYTFYDLRLVLQSGFHDFSRKILVDALTVLAMVEVLRTALAYFTEGRVKVTYIIDTVIVTVLTEVM